MGTQTSHLRHSVGVMAGRWARRFRRTAGKLDGASYRLRGGHPSDVPDNVLADRVRTSLGPLEKKLDVPHLHVMVERGVVLLHGEVGTEAEANELELAVLDMPGISGVESCIHVGLDPSDTRPSKGRQVNKSSDAKRRLLDAAVRVGVKEDAAPRVVRAVLATFCQQLPVGERRHVLRHLPADARALAAPGRRYGFELEPKHNMKDLVGNVIAKDWRDLTNVDADSVVKSVLSELHALVPEEVVDIEAVLNEDLRQVWQASAP